MSIEHGLQFLFLVVMQRLNAPLTMRSLSENYAASYRDPEKILREFKDALPPELLAQLKRVLHYHNQMHRPCHRRTSQARPCLLKPRICLQKMTEVDTDLSKEERTNNAEAFPCWIEKNTWLAPYPTRCDFQRRQKISSRAWHILLGDTIIYLYKLIRLYHRRNWTAMRVSHYKAPISDAQH